jgi:acyl dehydratase
VKPRSCQKPTICGHTCSGGLGTLSQRRFSSFSTLNSPSASGATAGADTGRMPAPPAAGMALALTTPPRCGCW